MSRQQSHERPLLRCLGLTGIGFLAIVPATTLVASFCLFCLWVYGALLMLLLGPVYSLIVGVYCAKTIRNSGPEWQMLLFVAALASGCAAWYCWGLMNETALWYEGYGPLAATTAAGVWVGPKALNVVRLAVPARGRTSPPGYTKGAER